MAKYRFNVINGCDVVDTIDGDAIGFANTSGIYTRIKTDNPIEPGTYVKITGLGGLPGAGIIVLVQDNEVIDGNHYIDVDKFSFTGSVLSNPCTVSVLAGKRYVNPLNFHASKFVWTKKDDQIFHRKKLSGKLKFIKEDYQYFVGSILPNDCCLVLIAIERWCKDSIGAQGGDGDIDTEDDNWLLMEGGDWIEQWKGYFTNISCEWNLSHCFVEVEPEINDPYACVIAGQKKQFNILPGLFKHTVNIARDVNIEQFECCFSGRLRGFILSGDVGCIKVVVGADFEVHFFNDLWALAGSADCPDFGGGLGSAYLKQLIMSPPIVLTIAADEIAIEGDICCIFERETIVTLDSGLSPQEPLQIDGYPWIRLSSTTLGGYPATKWGRPPLFTPGTVDMQACPPFGSSLEIDHFILNYDGYSQTFTDCLSISTSTFLFTPPVCFQGSVNDPFPSGRTHADVALFLAQRACSRILGVRSDFFEINPPGDSPGYSAGVNYVTGAANKLKGMLIYQKTDVLNPDADTPAAIGNLTFDELVVMWRIVFNAYWFIDVNGYVRVEHISWFLREVAFDTTSAFKDNNRRNKGLKAFSYDKLDVPVQEKFSFMEALGADFIGLPIEYSPACTNADKTDENNAGRFTTDVNEILTSPNFIDNDGFVLIALNPDDNTLIDKEVGLLTGELKNNAHLSWANLHYNYHRYNRYLLDGNMNGEDITFVTARRIKRQQGITYIGDCCSSISPLEHLIKTELGNGQIDTMEQSNRDQVYKMQLLHE